MQRVIAQRKSGVRLGWGITLAVVVATVVGVAPLLFQRYIALDPQMLAALGYPAIFLVNVLGSLTLFLPMPGLAVVFSGGSLLHPVPVAVIAATGMTIGMVPSYLLGSTGNSLFQKAVAGKSNVAVAIAVKVGNWFKRYGMLAAFLLAALPNPFFDFAGLIAGAVRMPLRKFLLGTLLGKMAQALVVALVGFYAATWLVELW